MSKSVIKKTKEKGRKHTKLLCISKTWNIRCARYMEILLSQRLFVCVSGTRLERENRSSIPFRPGPCVSRPKRETIIYFFISFRIVERILLNRDEEENSSFFNPFTTPALDVNETRQSPVIAPPMIFHEMEVEEKSIVVDPQMRRKIILKSVESQFIRTQQLVCFISTRGIHWCVGLILADRHPVCIPLNG